MPMNGAIIPYPKVPRRSPSPLTSAKDLRLRVHAHSPLEKQCGRSGWQLS